MVAWSGAGMQTQLPTQKWMHSQVVFLLSALSPLRYGLAEVALLRAEGPASLRATGGPPAAAVAVRRQQITTM